MVGYTVFNDKGLFEKISFFDDYQSKANLLIEDIFMNYHRLSGKPVEPKEVLFTSNYIFIRDTSYTPTLYISFECLPSNVGNSLREIRLSFSSQFECLTFDGEPYIHVAHLLFDPCRLRAGYNYNSKELFILFDTVYDEDYCISNDNIYRSIVNQSIRFKEWKFYKKAKYFKGLSAFEKLVDSFKSELHKKDLKPTSKLSKLN